MLPNMEREEQKQIVKEAITEWLNFKYAQFGKWTFHGIMASGLAVMAYYILAHGGFK